MHILMQGIKAVVEPDEFEQAKADGYKILYVLMPNNRILHYTALSNSGRYIQRFVNEVPGWTRPVQAIPEGLVESMNYFPAGKIPAIHLKQILKFFRGVMAKFNDAKLEAMAHVLWNEEQGYYVNIPEQRVSAGSVTYDWASIPANSELVLDIH